MTTAPVTPPLPAVVAHPAPVTHSRIFTYWRSGVLFFFTAVAVYGFAQSFFPALASKEFITVSYAIFAGTFLYLAKDTRDREEKIINLDCDLRVTQVQLAETQRNFNEIEGRFNKTQGQLQETEQKLSHTETRLGDLVPRLESDEKKIEQVGTILGFQVDRTTTQNNRFENSNDKLDNLLDRLETMVGQKKQQ